MADGPLLIAYKEIVEGLNSVVAQSFTDLANAVFPTITGLTIILIAWQGYKVYYGRGTGEMITNSLLILVKYAVIMAIFATYDLFDLFIIQLIEETPNSIARVMAAPWVGGQDNNDIIGLLDEYARTVGQKASDHSWGSSVGEKLEALVIQVVTYLYVAFAAVQFGIAEIVTKLFLMLTPLALAAIMFEKTKGIFEGWLRTLTTMAILKVLLIVMITLLMGLFGDAADKLEPKSDTGTASIGVFLMITILMILVTFRLPDLASQMGGGLSVSAAGVVIAGAAAAVGAGAAALAGGDRMQRGVRQGGKAAAAEGMGKGGQLKAALYRGATETARPGLTQRRFEDARMARRATQQVGNMKRDGDSGGGGGTPAPPPKKAQTPDQKAAATVAQMKRNTSNDN